MTGTTNSSSREYYKHPLPQRWVHWFNAVSFLFLWVTGIAIISTAAYRLMPQPYINFMNDLFGGPANLLQAHYIVGFVWITVLAVFFIVDPVGLSLRFLRDVVPTKNDLTWFIQRGKHELNPDQHKLPPQGAYNAGQKAFAWTVLAGFPIIALTGAFMVFGTGGEAVSRWMVLAHLLSVGVVVAFFFVHFTMAALISEERPALRSMFTGAVSESYAKHHHEEWFEAHRKTGGEHLRKDERFALPREALKAMGKGLSWLNGRREQPFWSPYAAGVGLGLTVVSAFALLGHGLGASGLFSRLGAFIGYSIAPAHIASNAYWGPVLDRGLLSFWLFWSTIGLLVGGFISAALDGRLKSGIDRGAVISPRTRIILAVLGGIIVGFATRFTRGCTSHQALSGGALLSVGSWVFMLSLFAGGFIAAFIFRRVWR